MTIEGRSESGLKCSLGTYQQGDQRCQLYLSLSLYIYKYKSRNMRSGMHI